MVLLLLLLFFWSFLYGNHNNSDSCFDYSSQASVEPASQVGRSVPQTSKRVPEVVRDIEAGPSEILLDHTDIFGSTLWLFNIAMV